MMRSSTRLKGLSTVNVFARICAKLNPSSIYDMRWRTGPTIEDGLRTFQQWWLALKATRPESRPPTTSRLDVAAIARRYALRVDASLRADIAVKTWARTTVKRAANGARRVELKWDTLCGWCAVVLVLRGGAPKTLLLLSCHITSV